jgi:hypothetical protein
MRAGRARLRALGRRKHLTGEEDHEDRVLLSIRTLKRAPIMVPVITPTAVSLIGATISNFDWLKSLPSTTHIPASTRPDTAPRAVPLAHRRAEVTPAWACFRSSSLPKNPSTAEGAARRMNAPKKYRGNHMSRPSSLGSRKLLDKTAKIRGLSDRVRPMTGPRTAERAAHFRAIHRLRRCPQIGSSSERATFMPSRGICGPLASSNRLALESSG